MIQRTRQELAGLRSAHASGGPQVPSDDEGLPAQPKLKRLALVTASTVTMEQVGWLWRGYVPLGKLTCLEGRMGTGKTTLLMAMAAAVTTGAPLPGQTDTRTGGAILISLEDGLGDTLVPRLRAAGAVLERCHLFDGYEFDGQRTGGIFNLGEDIERLRIAIRETGAVFVGIDPFTAALGAAVNSYKDQDVRRVLAPLAKLAEEEGTAICFVRHFRKGGSVAEDAGGGSVGIGAACRSVLRVDRDPENPDRYLLASVKSSLSEKPPTLRYRIEPVSFPAEAEITTSRIAWDGKSEWTADALAAQSGEEERPRAEEAQEWLLDALATGGRPCKDLFKAAEVEGIPKRTLQRAADMLRIAKVRKGFGEGSMWSLPGSIGASDQSFAPSTHAAPMGVNGANGTPPDSPTFACSTCSRKFKTADAGDPCFLCRRGAAA